MKLIKKNHGFSFIELLVVLFIFAMILSVILFSISKARAKSRDKKRKTDLTTIQSAVESYYADKTPSANLGNSLFKLASTPPAGPSGRSYPMVSINNCVDTTQLSGYLTEYLNPLPADPQSAPAPNYCYQNDETGTHYIIFSHLENCPSDVECYKSLAYTWWGSHHHTNINSIYPSTYHYYVSD